MKTLLCALLLTATLGCQSGSARVEQLFGGPEAMAALHAPDSTQAWRTTAKFAVKEGTETKGKPVGGEDFDRIHRALAIEVKKIFTNDPAIQKL